MEWDAADYGRAAAKLGGSIALIAGTAVAVVEELVIILKSFTGQLIQLFGIH